MQSAALEDRDNTLLIRSLREIEVGRRFPDVPVWTADGARSTYIHHLLPSGGVVVLLSAGCASCVAEAEAIQGVLDRLGDGARHVLLVIDQHTNDDGHVIGEMADHDIRMPLYVDFSQSFRNEYDVATRTAYFSIDSAGNVDEIRAWTARPSKLSELFSREHHQ